jgi:toxin HigB-1
VIQSFRHRGLKRFYEKDERRGLWVDQLDRIARILARLDEADAPAKMDLPGFKLHPLTGNLAGFWAVSVSGNWRIVFRFEGGHAYDVNLTDYH